MSFFFNISKTNAFPDYEFVAAKPRLHPVLSIPTKKERAYWPQQPAAILEFFGIAEKTAPT
jgi:hypothetical protein